MLGHRRSGCRSPGTGCRDAVRAGRRGLPGRRAHPPAGRASATDDEVRCRGRGGRRASPRTRGSTCRAPSVALPSAGRDDLDWVDFAIEHGIDLLAVSFVRRAEDLEPVERRIRTSGIDIPVIAKIEKPQAAERRRGDHQGGDRRDHGRPRRPRDRAADRAGAGWSSGACWRSPGKHSKPSITATQMLASMVAAPRPTRAEVSDVANAIFEGTDAVMLSEETAIGEHPVEAVRVMDRIARATEPDLPYGDWVFNRARTDDDDVADSVARAAVGSTYTPRPRRARRADPQRPHRAPRLRPPPAGAGPRGLAAARDRSPPQPALRRPLRDRRRVDGNHRRCSTTARASPARPASPSSGDLIGITAGLPAAGAGHEPVRGPPGSVRHPAVRALAPLALMGLIFYLSAQEAVGPELPAWTRVAAHFTEYVVLSSLWAWALVPALGRRALLAAAAISLLYAISDEYHQRFVPGRDSDVMDVLADSAGIAVALLAIDRVWTRSAIGSPRGPA